MRIEIRRRGGALAALDERGNPLMATTGKVKNYGRGNQVYLPKDWDGKEVVIVDLSGLE